MLGDELPSIEKAEPAEVTRGVHVRITGSGFPTEQAKITIQINEFDLGAPSSVGADGKSVSFRIPLTTLREGHQIPLPLGAYTVRATFNLSDGKVWTVGARTSAQDGRLRLTSDSGGEVKVTAAHPLVAYPVDDTFGLNVLGEGFSNVAEDNILVVENQGEVPVEWVSKDKAEEGNHDKIYGKVVSSRQMMFWGIPKSIYQGRLNVRVRVGDRTSEPFSITLSKVSKRTPLLAALVFVLLLGALLYGLSPKGVGGYAIGEQKYSPLTAMFLDPETDTFSLSKFQFYLWTAAAVFGYSYLTLAKSLIQWDLEFAAIPENLPGIIVASGSMTVLAQGITSARGPKGAGSAQPSFADFITTGGVVAAERFQFFVWTIVRVIAFLFLMLSKDPAQIQDLPKIPEGFLYLMGVSSAGYLGGKLVRKPGPIIDEIIARPGSLILEIRGRNLSQDAGFRIDDEELTSDQVKGGKPETVEKETEAKELGMAKFLRLEVDPHETPWMEGKHKLTLTNPDGQRVEWSFEVKKNRKSPTSSAAS